MNEIYKVIWSTNSDAYIAVPYVWGTIVPLFDGSIEECISYIKSNLN